MNFALATLILGLLLTPGNARGKSLSRSRKLPEKFDKDSEYLEQCSVVNFWEEQLGHVNVLAFFDPVWPLSHRQASLLNILKSRFENSGMSDIRFFLISAMSAATPATASEEPEMETWKNIWPEEVEESASAEKTVEALARAAGSEIFLIQDSDDLGMWEQLHASRDQIMILDRCGRLAFQVIVPWSILHFPYVKAAILSAYKDEPCGSCNLEFDASEEFKIKDIPQFSNEDFTTRSEDLDSTSADFTTTQNGEEETTEQTSFPAMPIRVIMRAPHHDGDPMRKHEFLVLRTNDSSYHEHLEKDEEKDDRSQSPKPIFDEDESPGLYGEVSDYWRNIENENNLNNDWEKVDVSSGNYEDANEESNTEQSTRNGDIESTARDIETEEEETKSKLIAHYNKLLPWIYYVLER